ncbi:MAG: lysylphosphatidylglycerol synthase domain-containing protein [Desulfobacterales bacterium]|nr:lysylphosphatidylglycerol synthase domain-containing protein [Desulfobacterales bacterium]
MKSRFINNKLIWIFVFAVLLIGAQAYMIPGFRSDVMVLLRKMRLSSLGLAFLFTLFHFFVEPVRWYFYLGNPLGPDRAPYKKLLCIFSVTALVTYIFPAKLGLPVRMYLLTSQLKVTLLNVTTFMALDGLLNYSLWGLPALIFLPAYGIDFPQYVLLFLLIIPVFLLLAYLLRHKLQNILNMLHDNMRLLTHKVVFSAIICLLFDIAGYVCRHSFILAALNTKLDLFQLAIITMISIFAGFISMIPMGLGAYDGTIILLLTQSGVPYETALLVPLVNRTGNILASIVLGGPSSYALGVSFWTLRRKVRSESDE